jgi:hypothetical protein
VYIDPGRPGLNEVHATYVGTDGKETPTRSLAVHATGPGGTGRQLAVRKLDLIGHFVADLPGAVRGPYHFALDATFADGTAASSTVTIPVR